MASKSVNKVILLGNLGKDAETKFTPSGISVSKFSLATGRRNKDQQSGEWKDITDWHNIVVWRTEHVANFLLKGKQIYLEGRLETRSYEDKEGQKKYFTEVICNAQDLVLLGGGAGRGDGPSEAPAITTGPFPCLVPRSVRRQRHLRRPRISIRESPTTTSRSRTVTAAGGARALTVVCLM
jgi:single-strand DNA-binding protein